MTVVYPELHAKLSQASPSEFVDLLFAFLDEKGHSNYDEAVTQLEHGLQAAALATEAGASDEVVVASLLHDIGHLLVDEFEGNGDFLKEDMLHETVAADFLGAFFSDTVTQPILHHVAAKRYLCTVDPAYHDGLSVASKRSLELQGGTLNDEERAEMDANPHLKTILDVRRWDDKAKVRGLDVPGLESYRGALESVVAAR